MAFELKPIEIEFTVTFEGVEIKNAEDAIKALGQASAQVNQKMAQETQRAAGQAGQAYQTMGAASERLHQNSRALSSAVGLLAGQIGLLGPEGNVAGNILVGLAGQISAVTLATAGAVVGVTSLVQQIKRMSDEKQSFDKAVSSKDIQFFRSELERLQVLMSDRNSQGWIGSFFNTLKGAILGTDEVLIQARLSEKIGAFRDVLNSLKADKLQDITRELQQQAALIGALRTGGPAARFGLEARFAGENAAIAASRLGFSGPDAQAPATAARRVVFEQEALAAQEARDSINDQITAVRAQIIALDQGAAAGARYAAAHTTASAAVKLLGERGLQSERDLLFEKLGLIEATQQLAIRKGVLDQAAAAETNAQQRIERTTEALNAFSQGLENQLGWQQKINDLDVEYLDALGRTVPAERLRIQNLITLNEERRKMIVSGQIISQDPQRELEFVDKSIAVSQAKLQQMGAVSVNVGTEISRALTDIFSAAVNGTLKLGDIGKSALAAAGRVAAEFFSQVLNKKLGFENILLTNLQGLPSQANAAVGAGMSALPGGSSGGGILSLLFGGGAPAGVQGPLMQNGSFFSGILSNLLPSGSSLGGLLGAGAAGFGLSSLLGGSGMQNILSTVGSIGGSLLGGTAIGGAISGAITSGLTGMLGGSIAGLIGDWFLPGIGSLLGLLFGSLFSQPQIPFFSGNARFTGMSQSGATGLFQPGSAQVNVLDSALVDASSIQRSLQNAIDPWLQAWTDILNLFPDTVRDKMLPALADSKALLNKQFAFIHFEGEGIDQQLQQFLDTAVPRRIFSAIRGALGLGFQENFLRAGLPDLAALSVARFSSIDPSQPLQAQKLAGLQPPADPKKLDEFRQALAEFVKFTSQLGSVSTAGVTPFFTEKDLALMKEMVTQVLNVQKGRDFAPALDRLKQQLQPMLDFLDKAVQQTNDIFGRGLIAALDAATESQAQMNFLHTLGDGVKQVLFEGITQSFIASANFTDLLAPIQKTIREFVQQAIDTRTAPDMAAFRAAIFPKVEDIATRAELLAPLIAELQKLGFDLKGLLGDLFGSGSLNNNINITINGNINDESDARTIADEIGKLLRGGLAPGA